MDEIRMLGTMLAEPDPAPGTLERSRHRLRQTMRGPVRKRRTGWVIAGAGLTAATVAGAVVIASDPAGRPATPHGPPAALSLSGRQVLLAAATSAAAAPATTGTYWHVSSTFIGGNFKGARHSESWTRRDGRTWTSDQKGTVRQLPKREPITVGNTDLGLAQIERLPTSPAQLIQTLLRHQTGRWDVARENKTLVLLTDLLENVPAPPKVRATALRALATLPHIKNLGKTARGQVLLFSQQDAGTKLVVDTARGTVSAEGFTDSGGDHPSMGADRRTAGWTNTPPPKVVPTN